MLKNNKTPHREAWRGVGERKCEEHWKVIQEDYLENPLEITPTYSVLFTIK